MNNVLSYGGLVDARISASEKDLPVQHQVGIQTRVQATNVYVIEPEIQDDQIGTQWKGISLEVKTFTVCLFFGVSVEFLLNKINIISACELKDLFTLLFLFI